MLSHVRSGNGYPGLTALLADAAELRAGGGCAAAAGHFVLADAAELLPSSPAAVPTDVFEVANQLPVLRELRASTPLEAILGAAKVLKGDSGGKSARRKLAETAMSRGG